MKTGKELMAFYEVEPNKKYIITKQKKGVIANFVGDIFEVKMIDDEDAVLKWGADGVEQNLFILESFDYKEYKENEKPILKDEEKKYLKAVIKPFRKRVLKIEKRRAEALKDKCWIAIILDGAEYINFPYFSSDDLYVGMQLGKPYTIKELGL